MLRYLSVSLSLLLFVLLFSKVFTFRVAGQNTSDVTVYQGATLFDGTGSEPIENSIVIISGQRIDCVGTESDCEVASDAEIIDLNGKYITPGLIDSHVHFFQTGFFDSRPDALDLTDTNPFSDVAAYQKQNPQRYYDAYLCSGITGVYDVGGFSWSIDFQKEAEQNSNAPHVAAAGPLITPALNAPFDLPSDKVLVHLSSAEAGIKTVRYLSELGSTGIKFWQLAADDDNYMKRVEAAAQEIRRQGNMMIAHATSLNQAKAALRNGTKLLVHSVSDTEVDEEFIELARENQTFYNPTLIVSSGYRIAYQAAAGIKPMEINDPKGCVDEKTRTLIETASQFSDHPRFSEAFLDNLRNFDPYQHRVNPIDAKNLKKLYEAGIPIVVGTDAGNPGTLHGISIFDEMEAMQQAGIDPADLIVMATQNGAKAMQRFEDFGTLEQGKFANIAIMDEDPSADISNMRSRTHIVIKGKLMEIGDL
ncbi:MAG: amidohydrolase family protein [Bacteroidetes bacterium]|jgi:imidazolonepropionase-like amidohydrolase|nr:amidohydrolase family protein [Bacteroidota bacterium]